VNAEFFDLLRTGSVLDVGEAPWRLGAMPRSFCARVKVDEASCLVKRQDAAST